VELSYDTNGVEARFGPLPRAALAPHMTGRWSGSIKEDGFMRRIAFLALASLSLAVAATSSSAGMGGMGGPSDAWGSPYVLYVPQSLNPPRWQEEGRAADVTSGDAACVNDAACLRRLHRNGAAPPQ
jgi:hypothetical protein